jgi:hypothetical protein
VYSGSPTPWAISGEYGDLFGPFVHIYLKNGDTYTGNVLSATSMSGQTGTGVNWVASRLPGFGPPTITGVTNAASGLAGSIAPGEIISIYAIGAINPIGPSTGVSLQLDQSGKVATTLGGVRVHFLPIDAYAPVTYASAGQINAVVPYEVAGLTNATIQVQYLGQTSNSFAVQVAATAPSIFTAAGTGTGQGAS